MATQPVTAPPVLLTPAVAEPAAVPHSSTVSKVATPVVKKAVKAVVAKPVAAQAAVAKTSKPAAKVLPKPVAAKKAVVAAKAAVTPAAVVAKEIKGKKPKLVRDSFTIPKDEYAVIETLKTRAVTLGQPTKKSELLRAGLKLLASLSDSALRHAVQAIPSIKTGRPKAEVTDTKPLRKVAAKTAKK